MASGLIAVIYLIARILSLIIIANALLSFAPIDPWHPVRRLLRDLSDPIVAPIRRVMPPLGMFDLSPLVALFAIQILAQVLVLLVQAAFS